MSGGNMIDGGAGNDSITVHGNSDGSAPTVSGGDGDDILSANDATVRYNFSGGNGNDILSGSSLADTLNGGAGNDTLAGGAGADVFVFSAAGAANGVDTLMDFVTGVDLLRFTGSAYGFTSGHVLTASEFTTGAAAVGGTAQFVWNAATHSLYWDHDGQGGDAAVLIATFAVPSSLASSDLHFT